MSEENLKEKSSEPLVEDKQDISPTIDKLGRAYATGRRKTSVSRVWIKHGASKIIVNGKASKEYFKRKIYNTILELPIDTTIYPGHHYGFKKTISIKDNINCSDFFTCKTLDEFILIMKNFEKNRNK